MWRKIFIGFVVLVFGFVLYGIAGEYFSLNALSKTPKEQVMGNPDGDVSVVEFLDYRCIYCQQAHKTITEAIAKDGNVRYIVRPVVMVHPLSMASARAVYAAGMQDKFVEMHERLITDSRDLTPDVLGEHAAALGLDIVRLHADMEDKSVEKQIVKNHELFTLVGTKATPTFMIGKKIKYVPEGRMPNVVDFLNMFNEARK